MNRSFLLRKVACLVLIALGGTFSLRAADSQPRLAALYESLNPAAKGATDRVAVESLNLYVPAGQPPTPFLPAGPFRVTWTGFIAVDLRTDMYFQILSQGKVTLEVGGKGVLSFDGTGDRSPLSEPIRLGKGPNPIKVTLTSPPDKKADAQLQVFWGEETYALSPVQPQVLTHQAGTEWAGQAALYRGRELTLDLHCLKCHAPSWERDQGIPDLSMDAPSFDGIGSRRQEAWMAKWIADPHAMRETARMPRVLHGKTGEEDARAAAAYLASLKTGGDVVIPEPRISYATKATADTEGESVNLFEDLSAPLFEGLHCNECHLGPDGGEPAEGKLSLAHVAEKFPPGKLAEFLRKPDAHYRWIRMPNFHLTKEEAGELADYILGDSATDVPKAAAADAALIERGRLVVRKTGCLNCHTLKGEANQFQAAAFGDLKKWTAGCLADQAESTPAAPRFSLAKADREALRAFGQADQALASLQRHVPSEFAERHTRQLNCRACHGEFEGFPGFDGIGSKMKPEWSTRILAGTLDYRPRHWLRARMPAFPARAESMAKGLAMLGGFSPQTAPEPPIDRDLAAIGHKLVGKEGGFSCVSCHAVGAQKATEVFEVEGINLEYATDRLLKPFYHRWITNPLLIDSQTKMPMYFDEGLSPLTEVLDGSADKQIEAMWQYFRLKDKMPNPNVGEF